MPKEERTEETYDKSKADALEKYLKAKGFIRVSPLVKKEPGQYSRSESTWTETSFEEAPRKYTIRWCFDQ